ncbi:MAG: hypothetical protein LKJ49_09280, partial [Olsenella sp.]|nr:hypothetical protein [Olsenella sp.]
MAIFRSLAAEEWRPLAVIRPFPLPTLAIPKQKQPSDGTPDKIPDLERVQEGVRMYTREEREGILWEFHRSGLSVSRAC